LYTEDIAGLDSGIYNLIVTDKNKCIATFSGSISKPDSLAVTSIYIDSVDCYDDYTGIIKIKTKGGTNPISYSIDNWNTSNTNGQFTNLHAGFYRVLINDKNNCNEIKIDTTVNENEKISVIDYNIGSNNVCPEDATGFIELVNVKGGKGSKKDYLWSNNSKFTHIYDLKPGIYAVTITDEIGCKITESFVISGPSPITIDSFNTKKPLCNSKAIGIDVGKIEIAKVSGGTPYSFGYKYMWQNFENDSTNILDKISGGFYSVTIIDSLSCKANFTLPLISDTTNYIKVFAGLDDTVCYNQQTLFTGTVRSSQPVRIINWGKNGATISTSPNLSIALTEPSNLVFVAYNDYCYDIDTLKISIYPVLGLEIKSDDNETNVIRNTSKQLYATEGFTSYRWTPQQFFDDSTSSSSLLHFYTDSNQMTISLKAITKEGCPEFASVKFTIEKEMQPPSGFTPNGDGIHDTWKIKGAELIKEVTIFNRWGVIVWSSKGYEKEFDGYTSNGKMLPAGTYYYVIILNGEKYDKSLKPYLSGSLTIIR